MEEWEYIQRMCGAVPNQEVHIRPRQMLGFRRNVIAKIVKVAVPNSIENGIVQMAKVALSFMVATFGTIRIAANGR